MNFSNLISSLRTTVSRFIDTSGNFDANQGNELSSTKIGAAMLGDITTEYVSDEFVHEEKKEAEAKEIHDENYYIRQADEFENDCLGERTSGSRFLLELYNKAIDINPNNLHIRQKRAQEFFLLGVYDKFIEDCTKCMELDTNNAISYVRSRAIGKIYLEDYKGAIEDYTTLINNSNGSNIMYYKERGKIYALSGNHEAAIGDYTKALELASTDEERAYIYKMRGDEYINAGLYDEAQIDLRKMQSIVGVVQDSLKEVGTDFMPIVSASKENSTSEDTAVISSQAGYYNDVLQRDIDTIARIQEFDFTKNPNGKIDEVHQGEIGDCYYLTSLGAYPELLEMSDCLHWNDDGSCDVFLYPPEHDKYDFTQRYVKDGTKRQPYHITKEELNSRTITINRCMGEGRQKETRILNPLQDIDLVAMEIALAKSGNYRYEQFEGGFLEDTVKLLFGQNKLPDGRSSVKCDDLTEISNTDLINIIKNGGGSAHLRQVNTGEIMSLASFNIYGGHAYMVNGYDEKTDTVILSNPHGDDRRSSKDDIKIPLAEFKNNFIFQYLSKV